jgi:hypothetical protein
MARLLSAAGLLLPTITVVPGKSGGRFSEAVRVAIVTGRLR